MHDSRAYSEEIQAKRTFQSKLRASQSPFEVGAGYQTKAWGKSYQTTVVVRLPDEHTKRHMAFESDVIAWCHSLNTLTMPQYAQSFRPIGPLRIDVTVTAKWPLWVLRNVTPFTPSHFRQSSEQIFLVLVFVFLKTVFFGICFQCFVNNISEKLNIFWTFS